MSINKIPRRILEGGLHLKARRKKKATKNKKYKGKQNKLRFRFLLCNKLQKLIKWRNGSSTGIKGKETKVRYVVPMPGRKPSQPSSLNTLALAPWEIYNISYF